MMPSAGPQDGNGEQALYRLVASLEEVRAVIDTSDTDVTFLETVLQQRSLRALVQVHHRISDCDKQGIRPISHDASSVMDDVIDQLSDFVYVRDSHELWSILNNPHIKALLSAHDTIAQKNYLPSLPDVPHEVDEDEETVKIVQLVKSNEPLGATIKYDEKLGTIVIARIMHGGAADRSGLIHVGDEVHEVNGISVRGKTPTDVLNILQSIDGTITFKLVPADERPIIRESKVRVRAHFDYNPKADKQIPCREAGLIFKVGDVLHIVNQDDPNWWQARKEGDRNMRAGLIPGRALQERRILAQRNAADTREEMMEEDEYFDREEIPTYEEVAKLYPRPGIHRPVILIGPPGVGRNELKRRLIAIDPDHFKTTIPHTSRTKKPSEIDGKEYHFVSRETMEEEINQGHFVEYGEYKGNLYGTSLDTVRSIINAGYVCVMNPHPQALKMLRTSDLKPYVIFIKPPPFERMKETRHSLRARSTFDENCSRGFTDDEFLDIIRSANRIKFLYGHVFDVTIENDILSVAFDELLAAVKAVEMEPQWVPASWVN